MLNDALASSHFAIAGQAHRPRRDRRPRRLRRAVGAARSTATARGSSPPATCGACSAAEAEARLRERLGKAWRVPSIGPGRASGWSGTRPSPTTAATPAAAGSAPCSARSSSRRSRCAPRRRSRPPTRRPCSPPRATCARARSARRPRSTASSARSPTCSPSTRSPRCRRATSRPPRSPSAPRLAAEDLAEAAPRRARQLRLVLDRLRAHLQGRRRQAGARGVRERLRARPAVRRVRSRRGARGQRPLRRARPRHDLRRRHDRLGDGVRRARPDRRAVAALRRRRRRCCARIDEIGAREGLGALLAEGSRAAPRRSSARARRRSRRTSRASSCPGYEPRTLQAMALGPGGQRARRRPQPLRRLRGRPVRRRYDRLDGGDRARRGRDRDRGPRRGHGLADPVQVPARRVRRAVPGVGARCSSRVTGWDVDGDELEATARRIVLAKRAFNVREGWTRADDGLPERFLDRAARGRLRPRGRAHARAPRRDDRRATTRPAAWTAQGCSARARPRTCSSAVTRPVVCGL